MSYGSDFESDEESRKLIKTKKTLILSSNLKSRNDSLRAWPWQIWNNSDPVSGLSLAVVENTD